MPEPSRFSLYVALMSVTRHGVNVVEVCGGRMLLTETSGGDAVQPPVGRNPDDVSARQTGRRLRTFDRPTTGHLRTTRTPSPFPTAKYVRRWQAPRAPGGPTGALEGPSQRLGADCSTHPGCLSLLDRRGARGALPALSIEQTFLCLGSRGRRRFPSGEVRADWPSRGSPDTSRLNLGGPDGSRLRSPARGVGRDRTQGKRGRALGT